MACQLCVLSLQLPGVPLGSIPASWADTSLGLPFTRLSELPWHMPTLYLGEAAVCSGWCQPHPVGAAVPLHAVALSLPRLGRESHVGVYRVSSTLDGAMSLPLPSPQHSVEYLIC